jgi:hypothetical protein
MTGPASIPKGYHEPPVMHGRHPKAACGLAPPDRYPGIAACTTITGP